MNKKKFLFLSAALAAVCMTSCIDNEEPSGLRALREGLGEKYKQEGQAAVITAQAMQTAAQATAQVEAAKAANEATLAQAEATRLQAESALAQARAEYEQKNAELELAIRQAEAEAEIANNAILAAAQAAAIVATSEDRSGEGRAFARAG